MNSESKNQFVCVPVEYGYKDRPLFKFAEAVRNGGPFDWNFHEPCNTGVLVEPSDLIVIDVDHPAIWKAVSEGRKLPTTYVVKTTRPEGGYHYYYRHSDRSRKIFKSTKIQPELMGLDIKVTGYVIGEGSYIKDRDKFYTVAKDYELAEFPDWVIDLYVKVCGQPKKNNNEALTSELAWKDLSWLINNGLKICDRIDAISNSRAIWAFGAGKDIGRYGWDLEACEEYLEAVYERAVEIKPEGFTFEEFRLQFSNGIKQGLQDQLECPEVGSPFQDETEGEDEEDVVEAEEVTPESLGFIRLKDSVKKFAKVEPVQGLAYPWPELNKHTGGMKPGEITFLAAATSTGKSTVIREVIYHLHTFHKKNVAVFMLEDREQKFAEAMMSLAANEKVNKRTNDVMQKREQASEALNNDDYAEVFEFDWTQQSLSLKNMKEKVEDVCKYCDTQYVFIDGITAITADTDKGGQSQVELIGKAVREMFLLAGRLNVSIFIITHTNELVDAKTGHIVMNSAFGAKAINQFTDVMLGFNKVNEQEQKAREGAELDDDEFDYRILEVLKEREDNRLGTIEMKYNKRTGRLVENVEYNSFVAANQAYEGAIKAGDDPVNGIYGGMI